MCSPKECNKCHKTTWTGCGLHVDQVMKDIPDEDQCKCKRTSSKNIFQKMFNK